MIVYCSSDWHCPPQGLRESVKQFIRKAKVDADLIVGNGDLFDLMEYPWKEFVNCKAVQEFEEELEGKRFIYVAGNHDPVKYVKRVIAIPNVEIRRREFRQDVDKTTYYFTHGHQWGFWWSWLRWLSDMLIVVAPPIYHWWLDKISPRKANEKGEKEKYNRLTGLIHSGASQFAERNNIIVVIGHTHKPWFAGDWQLPIMYDDGDMLDSQTYLRIEAGKIEPLSL